MADVSHELGSLRFVVESPLSSKVAMFNNQVSQHKQAQLLNPFSTADGRSSPKPTFSKDEYGKPLAGSLTEMRGQKANIHVMKEMVELCQIIDSEGYNVKDEPNMRVIPFGELFNIYNYISDKVVGILLRARKHKLVEFEGEMLFQRRDDDVPVFLLRPIQSIRQELEAKIEEIKRATSPAPQSTSVLLDKSAHEQKLQEAGLTVSGSKIKNQKSRTPSPATKKTVSDKTTKPEPTASIPTITTVDADTSSVEALQIAEVPPKAVNADDSDTGLSIVTETAQKQSLETEVAIDQSIENNTAEKPAPIQLTVDDNNNKADSNDSNIALELPTIVIETITRDETELNSESSETAAKESATDVRNIEN